MTREEALKIWDESVGFNEIECSSKLQEAISTAFKELRKDPCNDYINRRDVLDKINEVCFSKEQEWIDFRASWGSNGQRDLIIKFIESLPAIELKPKGITYDDVVKYCAPRCLTIITNELFFKLTHTKEN